MKFKFIVPMLLACLGLWASMPEPYSSLDEVRPFVNHGWFAKANRAQLTKFIDEREVKTVIEVGSWLGKSTIHMARKIPVGAVVYAIDHWKGSYGHLRDGIKKYPWLPYLYEQFLSNMIHAGVAEKVIPIRSSSLEAAQSLDIVADLIYIDAAHDDKSVYADLCAWYPKLAQDGVICGDDWHMPGVHRAVRRFAAENNMEIESIRPFWWIKCD